MAQITATQTTAQDFMVTRLVTLQPAMDVLEAVRLLLKHKISGAPVTDASGHYLGIFSEKCTMQVLLDAAYDQLPSCEVGAYMDVDAQTIKPDTHILSIAQVFLLTPYRRLPVLDEEGKLLGQVSRRDVIQAALNHLDCDQLAAPRERSLLYLSALFERQDAPVT